MIYVLTYRFHPGASATMDQVRGAYLLMSTTSTRRR